MSGGCSSQSPVGRRQRGAASQQPAASQHLAMGLELFALGLVASQLAVYGLVIGKSIRDRLKSQEKEEPKEQ